MKTKFKAGYYPRWDSGYVLSFLKNLKEENAAKLYADIKLLTEEWPHPKGVTVKYIAGCSPLKELRVEFKGAVYCIFFCVKENQIRLLHAVKKYGSKMSSSDISMAYGRMRDILI